MDLAVSMVACYLMPKEQSHILSVKINVITDCLENTGKDVTAVWPAPCSYNIVSDILPCHSDSFNQQK